MLSETFANQFSLTEIKPGKTDCPAALISWGDETSIPCRSTRMLRAMHIFVYHLPPPFPASTRVYFNYSGFNSKQKPFACEVQHWAAAAGSGFGLTRALCAHRPLLMWPAQMLIQEEGAGSQHRGCGLCGSARGRCPSPWEKWATSKAFVYQTPAEGQGNRNTSMGTFFVLKLCKKGFFCGSRQISFTFLFVPLLLVCLAKLNQNSRSCFMWSCCVRYFRQPQLWPRVAVKT